MFVHLIGLYVIGHLADWDFNENKIQLKNQNSPRHVNIRHKRQY